VSPFSLEVGQLYARELVLKLMRVKMNEAARKSEYRDFARVAAEIYRKQKQDWNPAARGPAANGTLNINGGN
jgi:hypothetical protein